MRILIVEDERWQRDVLAAQVAGWGHEVSAAATGEEALSAAASAEFDLFLLDVYLPDATAVELIPRLRGLGARGPVITLTGHSTRELERRLRELGIAYYMAKPVSSSELRSILEHMGRTAAGERPQRTLSVG